VGHRIKTHNIYLYINGLDIDSVSPASTTLPFDRVNGRAKEKLLYQIEFVIYNFKEVLFFS